MDQKLLKREEFEQTAVIHAQALLRMARRMTGDIAQAEDAVQETLLSAWRSYHQFKPFSNCRAWLFRILVNHLKSIWKRQRTSPIVSLPDGQQLDSISPLWNTRDAMSHATILSVVDSLSHDQRSVLMLAVVEGFTCKEIGLMLNIPIGTVMSRLSRARNESRKRLQSIDPRDRRLTSPLGKNDAL